MLYRIPEFKNIAIDPVKIFFTKMDDAEKLPVASPVNLELGANPTDLECPIETPPSTSGDNPLRNKDVRNKQTAEARIKKTRLRAQEDAAQFLLNSILNKLDTHPFKYELKSKLYCDAKLEAEQAPVGIPRTKEYLSMLPLQLKHNTVQDNINEYFKREDLDRPTEGCSGKSSKQANLILGEGKYLLIQLARFQKNKDGILSKIESSITINPTITVSDKQWAVQGAVLHTGTLTSGHYRYLWKSPQQWILFDDFAVSNPATGVQYELNNNGYILLYKKCEGASCPAKAAKRSRHVSWRNEKTGNNGTKQSITIPIPIPASKKIYRLTRKANKNRKKNTTPANIKPPPANNKPPPANNKPRRTQKKKYGFKSFIKSLLTPKDKAEYKKPIYTEDPLIKELVLNKVVPR